jgi:hypothetical protein
MRESGYEIAHYRPEHESQVVGLLAGLWKGDSDTRARQFRWKYVENPGGDQPLGIVALRGGEVAGFRGYFANRYVIGQHGDSVNILHPGDTCVAPQHQNRGLSVAMGNLALHYDPTRYRLFMNMTCSRNSLPGYMKLGFQPLAQKTRLLRPGSSLLSGFVNRKAEIYWPRVPSAVEFGRFGNVVVANSPRPGDMAAILAEQKQDLPALRLLQDEEFFAWRYRNPAGRYVFYFLMDGERVRAFIVAGMAANSLTAEIVDYGEPDARRYRELLRFIHDSRHFAALSVYQYGVDESLGKALADSGFSTTHPVLRPFVKSPAHPRALPLLIRPIRKSFSDDDFLVRGIDMRKIDSWRLKPICSDGA